MKLVEFEESLDKDLSWRKKEISDLYLLAKENQNEVLLKSLILLLYAHWEGFIKNSGKLYLRYVSNKNIALDNLESNFHAILIKKHIKDLSDTVTSDSIERELKFIDSLNKSNRKFILKKETDESQETSVINTEHNLSEKILRRIYAFTGLKYKSPLEEKKECIDLHLLSSRNAIAHGDAIIDGSKGDFSLSLVDIDKLKQIILVILDSIKEELADYASQSFYLIANKDTKDKYEVGREEILKKEFKKIEQKFSKESNPKFQRLIKFLYTRLLSWNGPY